MNILEENFFISNNSQQYLFTRYLIPDYSKHLFYPQNIDVGEYLNMLEGGLYSNSEKQVFLVEEVFPILKKRQNAFLLARAQDVLFNRLALCLRNNPELTDQFSGFWQEETATSEKLSVMIGPLMADHGEALFSPVNANAYSPESQLTSLDTFITSLTEEKKQEILTSALKKLLEME